MIYQTNIHVYGSPLVIGDAELIVNKIKKDEFRDEWNKDKHISLPDYGPKERKIKECNYFDLYSGGGCYTPIFSKDSKKKGYVSDFYLDHGAANFIPWDQNPNKAGSDEHLKIINQLLKNTVKNSKPIFQLSLPSSFMLLCEARYEIRFDDVEPTVKIDYQNETVDKIIDKLFGISCGDLTKNNNPSSDFDIYVMDSKKYDVYMVKSLEPDFDWYANYYKHYYDEPLHGDLMKDTMLSNNFIHGYYLKAIG